MRKGGRDMELVIKTKTEMLLGVKQLVVTRTGATKEGGCILRAATDNATHSIKVREFDSFEEATDALNLIYDFAVKKYDETKKVIILDEKIIDSLLDPDSYYVDPEEIPF